ncbi:MAG: alpha-N-acetylglucosaminidase [Muribaculaceae bacterium]|nr:alpha-N-acetylglucosaminidase [Muribaculaceae bacterium]
MAINVFGESTGIEALAKRLLGSKASDIVFVESKDSTERYRVSVDGDKIRIEGSNPSAMAVGLNRYLREVCHTDVSWFAADSIVVPATLPLPEEVLEGESKVPMRFFLNYCTYGYTMPYWQWNDWERFIDWMALQGVNMPLAIAGQEAVWQRVWRSFGLDDQTIRSYFSGPAHLPWHRMLNLDRWDGPLPQSYIDAQAVLQKNIVSRMSELGMSPVLPAFAGHVPPELGNIYPDVKIHPMSRWGGLDPDKYRSYFIEPSEPLFDTIQQRFMTEQRAAYGTAHIYGLDPFNEIEVPSWEEDYLRSSSKRIFESLVANDPNAIWVQMAWMFHYMSDKWTDSRIKAFLSGVSPYRMVLLDYYCDYNPLWEKTDSFHGTDFIWCYLGNFGGNSFLAGDMDTCMTRIDEVYNADLPNHVGVGGTLEGLDVNRHMHSYILDRAWEHTGLSNRPEDWISLWALNRGGLDDPAIIDAWKNLYRDIYHSVSASQGSLINARPGLEGSGNWTTKNKINYDNDALWAIWETLIEADSQNPAHLYDVVNVGRQVLGNHFVLLRDMFTEAYNQRDIPKMKKIAGLMNDYIKDYDSLLATSPDFLLGNWLNHARAYGTSADESDYYETNARHLITTWTQAPGGLNDYGNRDLSGLASSFYRERWRMFTDAVIKAVEENREWNGAEEPFYTDLARWEWEWCDGHESHDDQPSGNPKDIASSLLKKWRDINTRDLQ